MQRPSADYSRRERTRSLSAAPEIRSRRRCKGRRASPSTKAERSPGALGTVRRHRLEGRYTVNTRHHAAARPDPFLPEEALAPAEDDLLDHILDLLRDSRWRRQLNGMRALRTLGEAGATPRILACLAEIH